MARFTNETKAQLVHSSSARARARTSGTRHLFNMRTPTKPILVGIRLHFVEFRALHLGTIVAASRCGTSLFPLNLSPGFD